MWRPKQITKLGRTGLQQIRRSPSVPKGQLSHFARKYDPDAWNQLKGSIPSLLARVRCLPLKTWHLKRVGINYRHQWEHYTAWKAAESFSCCSLGEVDLLFVKLEIVKLTRGFHLELLWQSWSWLAGGTASKNPSEKIQPGISSLQPTESCQVWRRLIGLCKIGLELPKLVLDVGANIQLMLFIDVGYKFDHEG